MKEQTIEQKYQKKTQLEHILLRPDTYIGSTRKVVNEVWVLKTFGSGFETESFLNDKNEKELVLNENESETSSVNSVEPGKYFEYRCIEYVPGLYKIFDEILLNAIDQSVKSPNTKNIKIDINRNSGAISIFNDGDGIPVVMHKEHKVYVPELLFGHLLTSSNYNDSEKRIVGGKNGYGAKLTNIFSVYFEIETGDVENKLKYKQVWKNNMSEKLEHEIKPYTISKGYTKFTFIPDYKKFGLPGMTEDMYKLFEKRAYDAAACTRKDLIVTFNGQKLGFKTFERYVDLYIGKRGETKRIYELYDFGKGAIWEVAACMNTDLEPDNFMQISFVNGLCTMNGGKHVDNIVYQITSKLIEHIKEKATGTNKGLVIKPNIIKERLWVFIRATVQNPDFSSQVKDELTTPAKDFGFTFKISDDFITKLAKCGITDEVLNAARIKEEAKIARETDGRKRSVLRNIPSLDDANFAGGPKSKDCVLLVTEGESAKSFALAGLGIVKERDYYGVFPLRGKFVNVRNADLNTIANNKELGYLKQIIGLQEGKKYTSLSELRYGCILILTDQDLDGSHIKGLLINLFHAKWPELLKMKGFIRSMATPIVKATKGKEQESFYTLTEYNKWKENIASSNWKIKYYKGLGTSTRDEAREYFEQLNQNQIFYTWIKTKECNDSIILAFDKKKALERKVWLGSYNSQSAIEFSEKEVPFDDFIHKDLIHYSIYDNIRSIPNAIDGLKPSQRKVLFAAFKRKLKEDIKVVQFAGYISEHSAYHHGEASLQETIIGMAQDYLGSNNLNLLVPNGQFGTRLKGGKDHAAPRYIFTYLSEITRTLFEESDDPLLEYLNDDGTSIEPKHYIPILPLVLINGAEGIGTGYSTEIPCYNPLDIINNVTALIDGNGSNQKEMVPWYSGFTGTIEEGEREGSYITKGIYKRTGDKVIEITELPIGMWTETYKEFIQTLTEGTKVETKSKSKKLPEQFLDNFYEYHTDISVRFILHFKNKTFLDGILNDESIYKILKLTSSLSTSNMHLWDSNAKIKKYSSPQEIIADFYTVRLDLYIKRKEYLIKKMDAEIERDSAKIRFINDIIDEEVLVFRKKKDYIEQQLTEREYPKLPESITSFAVSNKVDSKNSYNYLTSMPIHQFTEEKISELEAKIENKKEELEELQNTTPQTLWKNELIQLHEEYLVWVESKFSEAKKTICKGKAGKSGKGKGKK